MPVTTPDDLPSLALALNQKQQRLIVAAVQDGEPYDEAQERIKEETRAEWLKMIRKAQKPDTIIPTTPS